MKSFLLLALVFALTACGNPPAAEEHADEHSDEESELIVLSDEAAEIAGIKTQPVEQRVMQEQISAPGIVTATTQGRAVVTPPVAGQVTRLHVKVGDQVQAGDPIATLKSGDLAQASARIIEAQQGVVSARADVKAASAELDLAKSKLSAARQVLSRQEAFAETGAFSQPALQAAQRELADAQAELERGKQDQAVHQAQLERAERLYELELISKTDLEKARLEVATDMIRQQNAERRIEIAKAAYERERRIAEQGLSNSREIQAAEADVRAANLQLEQARIRLNSAVAGVAAAQKGVEAARASYEALAGSANASGGTLVVKAPIGGVVVDLHATIGQAVERTTELAEIENLNSILVVAQLSDEQIGLVREGGSAKVIVSAHPERTFPGIIRVVGSRLDPKTRTMPVQILVDNSAGMLRTGMVASALLGVGSESSALVVPKSAIVEDGDARALYVALGDGTFEERVVRLGREQGGLVEVLDGVESGELVVSQGAFVLKSEKVKSELQGHEH